MDIGSPNVNTDIELLLNKLYTDIKEPTAFAGSVPLWKRAKQINPKISLRQVKEFLDGQAIYRSFKPVRRKFKRQRAIFPSINHTVFMDLAIYNTEGQFNSGYENLLVAQDGLSKRVWLVPAKRKSGPAMADALRKLFVSMNPKPQSIFTDKGTEFKNPQVNVVYKEFGVIHYQSQRIGGHAFLAERAIRVVKNRLERYRKFNKTKRWIDVIPDLERAMNASYNRSIGRAPDDVNEANVDDVKAKLYADLKPPEQQQLQPQHEDQEESEKKKSACKFRVGSTVVIQKKKIQENKPGITPKESTRKWAPELLTVEKCLLRGDVSLYRLRSLVDGKIVAGLFYPGELIRVPASAAKAAEPEPEPEPAVPIETRSGLKLLAAPLSPRITRSRSKAAGSSS